MKRAEFLAFASCEDEKKKQPRLKTNIAQMSIKLINQLCSRAQSSTFANKLILSFTC